MECYDFSRLDPDTLVTCPFDEVHRVSVQRLVRHLIKCAKVRCVVIVATRLEWASLGSLYSVTWALEWLLERGEGWVVKVYEYWE